MGKKNNYLGYRIISQLIVFFGNCYFGGKVEGKENIPSHGRCILAGNHVGNFDSYLIYKAMKRPVHIIAKKELFHGLMGVFAKSMHLIPVDRSKKNPVAKERALEILNDDKVLAIFPEGTYHKQDILLPFKPGVVSFSEKTAAPIIPFVIIGSFKFRSHPKIIFGKKVNLQKVSSDNKVEYLENLIREMYIKENSSR